ncbi:MAG: 60 kDa chaperonin, partial [candidate division CPR2 bacterium GW2011_GWC2_39_10]
DIIAILKKNSKKISSKEEIAQVATISAESKEMGEMIADVMDIVGKDGVVTVEESQTFGLSKEVEQGMNFDKGYISPYMITDVAAQTSELKDPYILITDKKISSIQEILPILEKIAQLGKKEMVIIAEDVDGEALTTLVLNKLRGVLNVLAIKAPDFGDNRKAMLEDIAILTGGQVVTEEKGIKLDVVELAMLGQAQKVIASKDDTTIVGGRGKKKDIDARVTQIKALVKNSDSDYEKEKLNKRMAKLVGGVAVIRVGAASETELTYIKHKMEDALAATKAAVEEGIVAGGGVVLANIARSMEKAKDLKNAKAGDEEIIGWMILKDSLLQPFKQLMSNANLNPEEKLALVNASKEDGMGVDVNNPDNLIKMIDKGIIDPVKVTRLAVENAVSVASTMITTEAIIVELPEDKPPMMPGGGGMDMGY